ncbi:uncharacterized protein LY89DRAFT_685108 [Mollisia scopiformis]|uniref:CENP-V/GFA domain-containing protein n=1 Tax=Mollisia scopiformis TaxID=149040 RepID=A0A194XAK9_MOLSC|nr:uncharacterized protein LY89DRAFT_685108 [Mollisia scopiformis]KUJ17179.1 hypothetical protein LY89DRAFT_685108 [Mollisia scopiformis]
MAQSTPAPVPELKTYNGNCHCGAFKFSVQMPDIKSVVECNCSICFRKGYKWAFPGEGPFTIERGGGDLKEYEFGVKSMVHKFCGVCGIGIGGSRHAAPPGQQLGINVRTLQDVDLWALEVNKYDGCAIAPAYEAPKYKGPEPTAEIENAKTYTGSCHCGAVTMALKTKEPLSGGSEHIQECNCSICARNGTILTYPASDQVHIENKGSLTSYVFGRGFQSHEFCGICGVSVYIKKLDVSDEAWEKESGKGRSKEVWKGICPVNLRCFDCVEWDAIQVKKGYYKDVGREYVVE